ncbi:DNA-binding transcriptional regulator, LysR family [Bosea lupini]|uniref:DNA-binding transcriptional regulator, LysR family n=1 Tax=Bosea lupini TaxID=1036779 RepID=A0A1H7U1L2_9HYPH|nr:MULTISPECIES: LysR substrate-binding domain-containing protein [Bosea]SEL90147.1 DNA-binding transcriptional regulator, LysR family [Bosea lupini]
MRLRQLECFRALMIHGTMTRVAELLGISQPGVSTMIAALEHDFGVPLFVRRGTRLQPTPEAHLIYAEASRALEAVENTVRVAGEIRAGKRGHLAITAYPSISIALLPRLLSVFAAERPGLQMKIITRASQSVKELMSTRTFDFAIAELPLDYPTAQMEVFSYQCQCMLPLGHPLAEREEITPADLDGVPFVTLFRGDPVYQKLAAAFSEYGARWNVVAETEFFSSACELVAAGIGVGIVDPVVSAPFTADVVRRPFRPAISYEIAILHPLHEELSQLAREFMVPLREALTA